MSRKALSLFLACPALLLLVPDFGLAQTFTLDLGGGAAPAAEGTALPNRLFQIVAALTVLGLAPSILVTVTSFTRLIVVFSILRTALGLQQSPPNPVLIGLALFLTFFIMQPTMQKAYQEGVAPYSENKITAKEAFDRTSEPVRLFMQAHARDKDVDLFAEFAAQGEEKAREEIGKNPPLHVVAPAFMISELRRAFEIGFLIYLPFLIIDMVVAATLMSMGMMMLPPVLISLPFKLIFFVLADGWHMLAGSLIKSYGT